MIRKTLVFHSALTPAVLRDTLSRTIDQEQWTLFSLSGFRGERPLLGEVGEDTFRLRKRLNYRNDFARQFYARFKPEQGGTRIEACFETHRFTRYFMRVWLAVAVLIGTPIFIMTVRDKLTDTHKQYDRRSMGRPHCSARAYLVGYLIADVQPVLQSK